MEEGSEFCRIKGEKDECKNNRSIILPSVAGKVVLIVWF